MARMVLGGVDRDRDRVLGERGETEAIGNSETLTVDLPATDDPHAVGQVDVVFLGLKAYSYASAEPLLAPLHWPKPSEVDRQARTRVRSRGPVR